MIENKVLKFGYGSIMVGQCDFTRTLKLSHIIPPLEVGQSVKESDNVTILETIEFKFENDMVDLLLKLTEIEEGSKQVEFRGYLLDFTNYNVESVNVLKKALNTVIRGWQLSLAC